MSELLMSIPEGWRLERLWYRDDMKGDKYSADLRWIGDERFGAFICTGDSPSEALQEAIDKVKEYE